MSRFWSQTVHQLKPYVPGEQPKQQRLVKLNTNENPYAPSPQVLDAIRSATDERLRLYPDPESVAVCDALADYHGLTRDQVFVGNGSDEVLAHVFCALLKHPKPLLFPDISYSFYPVYSNLYQVDYATVALDDQLRINVADYQRPSGAVILPNPNAPTGQLLPLSDIKQLLEQDANRPVIIDEAYIDFGGDTAAALIHQYDNLLVTRTLSKSRSLAGLRVGYALGQADLIDGLTRVKNSFNSYPLDRLAQAATLASIADEKWFRRCCDSIINERTALTKALTQRGFSVLPSAANFIFVQPHNESAAELAQRLRQDGIIVRYFKQPERINNWLRISIGTQQQHSALLQAIDRSN